jgi:signal transduction histidine kinase/putative methionine-R-sulfoxide reductase with GAF domain
MRHFNTQTDFESGESRMSDKRLYRDSELQTLQEINRIILESLDIKVLTEGILNKVSEMGAFDIGMICFVTAARRTLEPIAHRGFRDHENLKRYHTNIKERSTAGIADRVIATKQVRVIDLDKTEGVRTFRHEGVRSLVIVPLRADQDALGVMYLGSRQPREFDPSQLRLLEAVGTQAGIAVQKATQARERHALNIVATAISQSLRRDELLEIALDKVLEVTGRERVSIRLKDPATDDITLAAHRGFSQDEIVDLLQRVRHHGPTEQVLASGQPVVVNSRQELSNIQSLLPQSRSVAWIPMKTGARVVGILGISASSPVPFSQREVEFLQAIGNMIGAALENARLFSETEARYQELQTLHLISETILESLDLKTMMERILKHAFEIGKFDFGVVRLLNGARECLEVVASCGYRDPENVGRHRKKLESYRNGSRTTRVMEDRTVRVVDLDRISGMRTFKKEGARTIVAVPLRSHEQLVGLIQLGNRTPREFRESELRILDAIGSQAGIAIQKARLYEESKQAQVALAEKAAELARSNAELRYFADENKSAKEKLEKVNSVLTVQACELARSNTELEQFAYVASHDLQEPLRMVASYVQLLARRYKGKLDAEANEFIGYAVDGSKRMQDLINALLAYSRIGTKRQELKPTPCESVLATAIKNLEIAVEDSQAVITHDPLPTVMADAVQLGQLFQNLLGNAIKFRGRERPAVHVAADRSGNEWRFSFRDNGIGIDPQYSDRVFVIFQRLHSKEEYPGTGIGLALCKKIVERHGGRIWIESEPGKGSRFRFTIPAGNGRKGENVHGDS